MIAKFFSKIKIEQIAEVMNVENKNLVSFISEMVNERFCSVKINQPQRVVFFGDKHWNDSVDDALDKIVLVSFNSQTVYFK